MQPQETVPYRHWFRFRESQRDWVIVNRADREADGQRSGKPQGHKRQEERNTTPRDLEIQASAPTRHCLQQFFTQASATIVGRNKDD